MKIAIIGAGNGGGAQVTGWVRTGHDICFGMRRPHDDKTRQLVRAVGPKARVGSVNETGAFGEVGVWQSGRRTAIRSIRGGGLRLPLPDLAVLLPAPSPAVKIIS